MTTDSTIEITRSRLESLDVMRGLTVAFMILVNDPGDWGHVFPPLLHARWNGFTPTDLVFPSFLFIMGCAIPFSIEGRIARGEPRPHLITDICRRSMVLFMLGIFLALFPLFHLTNLRFFGVLQRFSICYAVCAILFIYIRKISTLWIVFSTCLFAYWLLVAWCPVPGAGIPGRDVAFMDPHDNIVSWFDRNVTGLTQHYLGIGCLYEQDRDPEGLLSTLPAFSTVISGMIAGVAFRSARKERKNTAITRWAASGPILVGAALLTMPFFPLNKNMWTSSFVLLCSGIDVILLFLLYRIVDVQHIEKKSSFVHGLIKFCVIFGSNPIVAFMLSELGAILLWDVSLPSGGSAGGYIYNILFSHGNSTSFKSLLFAISYVMICFIPSYLLWEKKIIIKI